MTTTTEQKSGGPKGSAVEKAQRDMRIFRLWTAGRSNTSLAAQFDLHAKTIENVIREMKRHTKGDETPEGIVDGVLLRLEQVINELSVEARKAKGSAKVQAIKTRAEVIKQSLEIQQRTGRVPHDLGVLKVERDQREVGRAIIGSVHEVLRRAEGEQVRAEELGQRIMDRVVAELEGGEVEAINGTAREVDETESTLPNPVGWRQREKRHPHRLASPSKLHYHDEDGLTLCGRLLPEEPEEWLTEGTLCQGCANHPEAPEE